MQPRRYPSCSWLVTVEARRNGALGVFMHKLFTVRAKDQDHAISYALANANDEGYETRNVIAIESLR
jgi:hypothetical protein